MKDITTVLVCGIVLIAILYWIINRPTKTVALNDNMFIADIRRLPDGLYVLIVEEISVRMASYALSTSIGQSDKIFILHHSQIPINKITKKFRENFYVEAGKIIS